MPFGNNRSPEEAVEKVRKLLEGLDNDNFFSLNSPICVFAGTIIMWVSLPYPYGFFMLCGHAGLFNSIRAQVNYCFILHLPSFSLLKWPEEKDPKK